MFLKTLFLKNFRSWKDHWFEFDSKTTVIVGPNASGKTNILEAIWFLAQGKSFRAEKTSEVISWQESQTQIKGIIKDHQEQKEIGVTLIYEEDKKRIKKSFVFNRRLQTRKAFLTNLYSVVFQPDDIRLVAGSPSRRRQFLDQLLLGVDWEYQKAWQHYSKALKQRNQLLDQLNQGKAFQSELFFWDQSLVKNSDIIIDKRRKLIDRLNFFLEKTILKILNGIKLNYQPSPLSLQLLAKTLKQDIAQGFTTFGPQKDDFQFLGLKFPPHTNNLASFGSRGQQRLASLGLKLAEMEFIREQTKKLPLILLDDIFSELDPQHQKLILRLGLKNQIILTTTQLPKVQFWDKVIKV